MGGGVERGAGFFLPMVWGCPPDINKSPKIRGLRGLTKVEMGDSTDTDYKRRNDVCKKLIIY
jgi:hypothetical protein